MNWGRFLFVPPRRRQADQGDGLTARWMAQIGQLRPDVSIVFGSPFSCLRAASGGTAVRLSFFLSLFCSMASQLFTFSTRACGLRYFFQLQEFPDVGQIL